jgi:hypothetical protein
MTVSLWLVVDDEWLVVRFANHDPARHRAGVIGF